MNYLLELGTEEIPARFVDRIVTELKQNIFTNVDKANIEISLDDIKTFATYRRLAIYIKELGEKQKDVDAEFKGPPLKIALDSDGNLSQAGNGFLKKWKATEYEERDGYLYAKVFIKGKRTEEVLDDLIQNAILKLYLPIAMKWGDEKQVFVRPVHWILSLLDNKLLPLSFAGKLSGNVTYGHRFLSGSETLDGTKIEIKDSSKYEDILAKQSVIVDSIKRKEKITQEIKKRYPDTEIDEELLDEVNYLVEYPRILEGNFPKEFLDIPDKILTTSMKKHQKYFPVYKNGKLQNKFLIAADNVTDTNPANIILGNERVLNARLHDAQFFFSEDTKHDFDFFNNKLKFITFQQKLGSVADKNKRNLEMAKFLIEKLDINKEDEKVCISVVENMKADLSTSMVFEFTELQGYVGQQYAIEWGFDKQIANGIYEHYMPAFAGDNMPSTIHGTIASLSDKIDTICGHFSIGNTPSGSQDPYALRRQANGIVLILMNNKDLQIDLSTLLEKSLCILKSENSEKILKTLEDFFLQRIFTLLKDQDIPMDTIKAANTLDISLLKKRLAFIEILKPALEYKSIIEAIVRVLNITKNVKAPGEVDPSLFQHDIEETLYDKSLVFKSISKDDTWNESTLHRLAKGASIINAYFDDILVMDKDEKIKNNRLSTLYSIATSTAIFANFKEFIT